MGRRFRLRPILKSAQLALLFQPLLSRWCWRVPELPGIEEAPVSAAMAASDHNRSRLSPAAISRAEAFDMPNTLGSP
jgi:hypothetical protein